MRRARMIESCRRPGIPCRRASYCAAAYVVNHQLGGERNRQEERASSKDSTVPPLAFFGISVVLSFVAWGSVTAAYFWPALRNQPRARALRPLLLLHSFRFMGLAFLVPGVVSQALPGAFARPAAYGDLIAAVLALRALAGLQGRQGIGLVWVFNLWGSADLLFAFYQGSDRCRDLGQATWVPLTSFRPSWYRCSLSRTGLCSGSYCRATVWPKDVTVSVLANHSLHAKPKVSKSAASRCSAALSCRACCLACHRFRKRDGQAVWVDTHRQPDTFVCLLSWRHHEACSALAQRGVGAIEVRH